MPDGTVVHGIPDGTSKDDIMAKYQASLAPKPDMNPLQATVSGAKAAATGATKGLLGATLDMPGNLVKLLRPADMGPGFADPLPTSESTQGHLSDLGLNHVPANDLEKGIEATTEGAASMVGPGGLTKGAAALGGISGLAGEVADKVMNKGGDDPIWRAFGNIAGLLPDAVKLKTPQVVNAIQGSLKELGPEGLERAAAGKATADATLGTPTLLTHQLPASSPLAAYAAEVAANPAGGAMRDVLGKESSATSAAKEGLISALSKLQLGSEAENAVNKAGQAATYANPERGLGEVIGQHMGEGNVHGLANALSSIVDDIQSGPLGKIFSRGDQTGNLTKHTNILSPRFSAEDVDHFATQLNAVDPTAFPMIMKKAAMTASEGAGGMSDFVERFAGNGASQQRANVLEGIKQTALAHGETPEGAEAAAKGAETLLGVLQTVGAGGERMLKNPIDTAGFAAASGESVITKVLRLIPNVFQGKDVLRTWAGANMADKAVQKNTFSQLADIFTSPDGVSKLKEIASYSRAGNAVSLGTRGLASAIAQQQPN